MAKSIKMTIPLNGISQGKRQINFETDGFQGASCKDATKAFEEAIGTTTDETLKDEFYQTEERQEFLNEGGEGPAST